LNLDQNATRRSERAADPAGDSVEAMPLAVLPYPLVLLVLLGLVTRRRRASSR
jgi:hypothetical protein